jgi:hypothetical protein
MAEEQLKQLEEEYNKVELKIKEQWKELEKEANKEY